MEHEKIVEAEIVGRPRSLVRATPQQPQDLTVAREPEAVLAEAHRAAAALKKVLDGKKKKVEFNGEQYLEFEDWQTVGRFYGITPTIEWTRYVEFGEARGFEARALAIRSDGEAVGAGEAMCLTDEEKWSTRPKYEWHYVKKSGGMSKEDPGRSEIVWEKKGEKSLPKKQRVYVGEEPVPLFQLRSMAQTRAQAKALRSVLAWVVVLAGYRPTPAEELDGKEPDQPTKGQEEPPNSEADMGEAFPGQQEAPKPPPGLLASFAAIGVTKKEIEDFLERDIVPGGALPQKEIEMLKSIHEQIKSGKVTWPQIVEAKAEMLKAHATA